MARHLLIGDGTTSAMSSGVEAAGAINIQKLSSSGPVDLVVGDSIAELAEKSTDEPKYNPRSPSSPFWVLIIT